MRTKNHETNKFTSSSPKIIWPDKRALFCAYKISVPQRWDCWTAFFTQRENCERNGYCPLWFETIFKMKSAKTGVITCKWQNMSNRVDCCSTRLVDFTGYGQLIIRAAFGKHILQTRPNQTRSNSSLAFNFSGALFRLSFLCNCLVS